MRHHLLHHLDSSMRSLDESRSRRLSARYADAWRAAHRGATVTYRDLAADPPPHLDLEAFSANMVTAEERTPAQAAARALTEQIAGEALAADTIVLGMGLYNFGAPSTVKAWLDRLVVPGLTVGEEGGLLGGRPGLSDVHVIAAELTLARESPAMIPLNLGDAEDASYAAAQAAIDDAFAVQAA